MKEINAKGMLCPMPLIETKKALTEAESGETIKILIDNETSVKNVQHYLEDNGILVEIGTKGNDWELIINKGDENVEDTKPEEYCEVPEPKGKNYVVLFAKDKIGEGSDELGSKLLGSFLESLKAQDKLPDQIIYLNSGINLVTKGSEFLPLIVELELNGVEMISCGTCLNFYNKMNELELGRVSNMFEIVEIMRNAGQVITL